MQFMSETFPEDLRQFVQHELASGHYGSTRELLVEGLRLLQRDRAEAVRGIRSGLDDVEAGRLQPLAEAFEDLRNELGVGAEQ
jgi:putative addiction module CopG family antidote